MNFFIVVSALRLKDELYVEPERRQYAIDNVVFVPSVGVKQTSYITLNFTGYGTRSTGRDAERKGVIYIFFADNASAADVSVTASTAGLPLFWRNCKRKKKKAGNRL